MLSFRLKKNINSLDGQIVVNRKKVKKSSYFNSPLLKKYLVKELCR